jgi:hypothetical protein
MDIKRRIAGNLAVALSSGPWTRSAMARRAAVVIGGGAPRSLQSLIDDVLDRTATPYPPPPVRLAELIRASSGFSRIVRSAQSRVLGVQPVLDPPAFSPAPAMPAASFPVLATPRDLADWLEISLSHLDWFADERRQHGTTIDPVFRHYSYAWVPRKRGKPRLIESPRPRLKALQRRVLRGILDHLPAHDCAHGFVRGRSCRSGAAAHAGEAVVVSLDLKDFFLTTPVSRVHGVFRSIGYPWPVARRLTGLCTTMTPGGVFDDLPASRRPDGLARQRFRGPHLPQGAPTSPALANLCAWRLDCRLHGLARHMDARYTRYADDLAFSGDEGFAARVRPFLGLAETIIRDEAFAPNPRKTRVMRRSNRQRVTGLVVNDHLNVPRPAYDALKAVLHNCLRHGPAGQNRDGHADFRAHLDGRVTWVETVNPQRGLRLRRMFEAIVWADGPSS